MESFSGMPNTSRTWVYAANRTLTVPEQQQMQEALAVFTRDWTAHNNSLKAEAAILYNQFVVIMVDEAYNEIGGCSIDKSIQLLKALGNQYKIDFFNRFFIYVLDGNEIITHTKQSLQEAINKGLVNQDSLVFNHLVQSKSDLTNNWIQALKQNWISKQLRFLVQA
ncbi:MAG: hypothetical protein Q8M15_09695 [Bacteroidota bacterium]|nr:hypothetical protein [Bacteroidota bacterium]